MKRLLILPLCLIVFMLCTAESCKEKKADKVVKKLLSTWNITSVVLIEDGMPKSVLDSETTDADKIKTLRIDFDKYLAQHGDLFWFATYGDDSQEKLEGRYEVGTNTGSKTIAITIYLDSPSTLKILPDLKTKTYFFFEAPTDEIKDDEFRIASTEYEKGKSIILKGTKF